MYQSDVYVFVMDCTLQKGVMDSIFLPNKMELGCLCIVTVLICVLMKVMLVNMNDSLVSIIEIHLEISVFHPGEQG